ncbi:MAG TPA: hypothetical protein VGL77_01080 [Armatimonadota bacterium]|jgi:hypothetical protein
MDLHIHCGDCSADQLRLSGLPGDILVWKELLHEGPTPFGLADDAWMALRARFLASTSTELTVDGCLAMLQAQDAALARFQDYQTVTLWFDACLYDQTILIRQLDWFARHDRGTTNLMLLCIGEFPGMPRFSGLGELSPPQLASLLPQRQPITAAQLALAQQAWHAFRSPAPTTIRSFLDGDTSALPYLADALYRHLAQFPAAANGLNRVEQTILTALARERQTFSTLFRTSSIQEARPFFGDTTFWSYLNTLASEPAVLTMDCQQPPLHGQSIPLDGEFRITALGEQVLAGNADWITLHGIDRWLGGVQLTGNGPVWRWDAKQGHLCLA